MYLFLEQNIIDRKYQTTKLLLIYLEPYNTCQKIMFQKYPQLLLLYNG